VQQTLVSFAHPMPNSQQGFLKLTTAVARMAISTGFVHSPYQSIILIDSSRPIAPRLSNFSRHSRRAGWLS
jgi:hypothetical protein